ncbi:MAG: adenylate/guanylate cyclase domain-containing protein [Deltaproteobacteria bacterium]
MTEERAKRKLTAILSADVKGYSRLMGEDELYTIETLKSYREVISSFVREYGGRVVDSPGDNILAAFDSVVDAAECAVKIQEDLKVKNASLSENRRMEFRIGVNLGDVIDDEGRIYGDGVNVAARIEGLADGGGVCISGTAFDQIGGRLPLGYAYLGEQKVKNIEKPIRVYKVLTEPEAVGKVIGEGRKRPKRWPLASVAAAVILVLGGLAVWNLHPRPDVEPASVNKMVYPLPDKPSIAVLPFANLSGDPQQEFFSDGFTEHIITGLSRIPHLFVIARTSTCTYKGKPVKVQQVSEELGVRYVLEGSIQKTQKRIRVEAQLIDAVKGHHLWADTYDRNLEDLFALQDDITMKIITSLQVELTRGGYAKALGKGTKSIKALESFWRGENHIARAKKEDNALARQYAEEAIESDSGFASAQALLGFTYLWDYVFGWSSEGEKSLRLSEECAHKTLALDDSNSKAFILFSQIYCARRDADKAIGYGEKAVEANPNDPWALYFCGLAMKFGGRYEEAITMTQKSMRLTPYYPALYLVNLGYCCFHVGRYDEALSAGEKLLERCRKGELADWFGYLLLVAVHNKLGNEEKARVYADELLKANPNWKLRYAKRVFAYKNELDLQSILSAGRKAGLPD